MIDKEDAQDVRKGHKRGTLSEDIRWARDRTGWAPQFKTEPSDDEGTLLDHQTFLEGKLSDKFYGGGCPSVTHGALLTIQTGITMPASSFLPA